MRFAGAMVGGALCSACALLTPLSDLRGDAASSDDAGSGSIAFVQGRTVHESGPNLPTHSTSLVLPGVVAHHALVVAVVVVQSGPPIDTIQITDDQNDVFTPTSNIVSYDGWANALIAGAFDVHESSSTVVSVVANGTTIAGIDLYALEYAGVSAFDVSSTGNGHTMGPDGEITDVATTTGSPDLLVALAFTDASSSAGTDFMKRLASQGNTSLVEDRIVSTAGPHAATATMDSGGNYWLILMSAFK